MKKKVYIVVYVKGGMCQEVIANLPAGIWDYTLVDYDNQPDLPADYTPYSPKQMQPVRLLPDELLAAARKVIAHWESSHLAEAVRDLDRIVAAIDLD